MISVYQRISSSFPRGRCCAPSRAQDGPQTRRRAAGLRDDRRALPAGCPAAGSPFNTCQGILHIMHILDYGPYGPPSTAHLSGAAPLCLKPAS